MKKQKNIQLSWPDQIKELVNACDEVLGIVKNADEDMGHAERQSLEKELAKVKGMADRLYSTLYQEPVGKIVSLDRMNMTEEQYYLLCANGCKLFSAEELGISPVSDYQAYLNCCYEDEEQVCYIDPREKPPVENERDGNGHFSVRLRIGCYPEELHIKHLRPSQKEFFKEYMPELLARFQQD